LALGLGVQIDAKATTTLTTDSSTEGEGSRSASWCKRRIQSKKLERFFVLNGHKRLWLMALYQFGDQVRDTAG
jgi:hypothetical protein